MAARECIARALLFDEGGWTPWEELLPVQRARLLSRADAILAALRDAGWCVVPEEPTKEMIVAGQDAHDDCVDTGFESDADGNRYDYTTISPDAPSIVYRAMLAAAQREGGDG